VVVPVNARFRHRELRHVIRDAEMRVLFVGDAPGDPTRRADVVSEALRPVDRAGTFAAGEVTRLRAGAAPRLEAVVTLDLADAPDFLSQQEFSRLARDATREAVHERRRRVAVRDVAMMFYTSGTTSMPKGCLLSHEALVRTGICTCPMFHTASTQPMIAAMHALGTMVTMGHFEPEDALALVENEDVTAMFPAFPALTEGMLSSPHYRTESFRRVRTVFTVAPTPALRSMQQRMPHTRLVNAYGMTEFGGSVVMVSPEDEDDVRLGTQGPPFPGIEIGIRDESNADLDTGRQGEIVVRGPSMFAEYHRDPAKTAECIDVDGWFHTGDLGAIGVDGRLRFQGRLKDMLKIGGENVAAIEIAGCLQELAQVGVAHVVGIADAKYGEVPAAFIELRPGASLTEQDAIEHCAAELARFKVPRYVRFVTEWPMSSTKVQTARLREQLEIELRAGMTVAP
jgi:fatty-acyl-CoA synthase